MSNKKLYTSNKDIATRNKGIVTSSKKLLVADFYQTQKPVPSPFSGGPEERPGKLQLGGSLELRGQEG